MTRETPLESWSRERGAYRTPANLRGVPCRICGSTRSVRGYVAGYGPSSARPARLVGQVDQVMAQLLGGDYRSRPDPSDVIVELEAAGVELRLRDPGEAHR